MPAVVRQGGKEHNPALFVGRSGHRATHNAVVGYGNHRVVFFARGQDLCEGVDGLISIRFGLVSQRQDGIGIDRVVFADTKRDEVHPFN